MSMMLVLDGTDTLDLLLERVDSAVGWTWVDDSGVEQPYDPKLMQWLEWLQPVNLPYFAPVPARFEKQLEYAYEDWCEILAAHDEETDMQLVKSCERWD